MPSPLFPRFSRPMWTLLGATLLNRAGTMALPFLVLYLASARGYTSPQAGAALIAYGAGALVAGPLAGALVGRVPAVWVMRISLSLSSLGPFVLPHLRTPIPIVACTFGWALVAESFRPPSLAVVADLVAPTQLKQGYAALRLAGNLGTCVGPAVGGVLATVSFPWLFAVDGVTSLLAALVLFLSPFAASRGSSPAARGETPAPSRLPALARFAVGTTLVGMLFYQCESTMPLYIVDELHLSSSRYGLLFTVNTALVVSFEILLTARIASWSTRRAVTAGALLIALGFSSFAAVRGFGGAVGAVVVWTFGEMLFAPSASAYVAELAPRSRRALYLGLHNASWSVALMLGPWLGTVSLVHFGPRLHWIAVGAVGGVAALVLAWATAPARS